MASPNLKAEKSPVVFGLVVGGFVWLVFDSLVFGGLAGFATYVLIQRDQDEDAEEE